MNFVILRFDEVGSTNTEALEQAQRGADEGTCVVARSQTAGRGRYGREWRSPNGSGFYFSILLRPRIVPKYYPLVTLMTAVAVHEMLAASFAIAADIKWPNDVHVAGKKICGILAELIDTEKGHAVVVGIGINLSSENFPPEFNESATSIAQETGNPSTPEQILPLLTAQIAHFYDILESENGAQMIRDEWAARSTYHTGKDVRVILPNETLVGTTCGLEENGALRVKQPDGEIRVIHAGDVEKLRAEAVPEI